jgi:LPS-assembly lipoprotein
MTSALRLAVATTLALALMVPLSACGLRPMYAGGANGAVAQGLAAVDVPAIEGREGWLVRNALVDRLGQSGGSAPARYRLDVLLDDQLEGLGLLTDDTIGRERRTLRARYQLVDVVSGEILLDATAGSDAGIDVVSSEYATIAAEQTALENLAQQVADRIVTQLTLTISQQP